MNQQDVLIGYRVGELEKGHKMLTEAVQGLHECTTEIVRQISIAKWVLGAVFGVVQPVLVLILSSRLGG